MQTKGWLCFTLALFIDAADVKISLQREGVLLAGRCQNSTIELTF